MRDFEREESVREIRFSAFLKKGWRKTFSRFAQSGRKGKQQGTIAINVTYLMQYQEKDNAEKL